MPANYEYIKQWRARHPDIRTARREEARKYRKAHPEVAKAACSRHREKHIDKVRERDRLAQAEYRKTDRYKQQAAIRMRRYKERQREERLKIAGRPQPEVCDICRESEFRIVWDHCHAKGHFRGWICDRCNRVLGLVRDNQTILLSMAEYLEEDRGKTYDEKAERALIIDLCIS